MLQSRNPFITSAEVFSNEDFFDRKSIMDALDNFIANDNESSFLIFGQRRMGKTSVLKKLQNSYEFPPIKTMYMSLQSDSQTPLPELLAKIASRIAENLDLVTYRAAKLSENDFLNSFLNKVKSVLSDSKLIILFDEFDVLSKNERFVTSKPNQKHNPFIDFYPHLIQRLQSEQIALKLVLAIGRNYRDFDNERYGDILNISKKMEIPLFTKQAVFDLLGVADSAIPFDAEAKEKVWNLTGGQPYFTQCLASYAFNKAETTKTDIITNQIVEASLMPTIRRFSSGLIWIWDTLLQTDKHVMTAVANITNRSSFATKNMVITNILEKGHQATEPDIELALQRLTDISFLIRNSGDGYQVKSEFFRKWIIKQIEW